MSSQAMRQQCLDVLNASQNLTPAEVCNLMPGAKKDSISRCLTAMFDIGECYRELDIGTHGTPYRYTALVIEASPSPCGRPTSSVLPSMTTAPELTGHYIHNDPKRKPTANPDCQCCAGPRFCSVLGG